MNDDLKKQLELQQASKIVIDRSPLLELLAKLGKPTQTGSSVTGLMTYPDIDFTIQHANPDIQVAIDLVPTIFAKLKAVEVKVADFQNKDGAGPVYYVGIRFPFNGDVWHIDATMTKPGPIVSDPPELDEWLKNMTEEQRLIVLQLKKQLIKQRRYVGARSQPPYTFRSVHLYEGIFKGNARTIEDLENYFQK